MLQKCYNDVSNSLLHNVKLIFKANWLKTEFRSVSMRAAAVNVFSERRSGRAICEDLRRDPDALRSGTLSRIAEMKREISLLINEFNENTEEERELTIHPNEAKVTSDEFEPLSNSVRIIKLKNS